MEKPNVGFSPKAIQSRNERFGVFAPLFERAAYLKLLNLGDRESLHSISLVVECCAAASDPHQDVDILLHDANWRPHLVAAVAIVALDYVKETNRKLWAAIDAGSWVTPQLAAAASFRDPAFVQHAMERLQSGCAVDFSRVAALSAAERHSACGPSGSQQRSAKTAASLVRLLRLNAAKHPVSEEIHPDVIELAGKDVDSSGDIAEHWRTVLKRDLIALNVATGKLD